MSGQTLAGANRLVAPVLVAGSVLLGALVPTLSHALFPFIFIALFCVVLFSLCSLDKCPTEIIFAVDRIAIQFVAWQLIVLPSLLVMLTKVIQIPDTIAAMMLATVTAGSVFASPALVGMVGLDRDQATRCMVISTIGMPISLLVFGELLGVIPPSVSLGSYVSQINFFLIIPMILALVYWSFRGRIAPKIERKMSKAFSMGATFALMVFCIGAMNSISGASEHQFVQVFIYGMIAVLLALVLFSLTAMAFSHLGPDQAVLAGMLSANRNVALAAAFLDQMVTSDLMVYVAVSQFPIFLFPLMLQLAKWARGAFVQA